MAQSESGIPDEKRCPFLWQETKNSLDIGANKGLQIRAIIPVSQTSRTWEADRKTCLAMSSSPVGLPSPERVPVTTEDVSRLSDEELATLAEIVSEESKKRERESARFAKGLKARATKRNPRCPESFDPIDHSVAASRHLSNQNWAVFWFTSAISAITQREYPESCVNDSQCYVRILITSIRNRQRFPSNTSPFSCLGRRCNAGTSRRSASPTPLRSRIGFVS